jgi:hypothetical protein
VSQRSDGRTLSNPMVAIPAGASWRPKVKRQQYGELARAGLRLITSACSCDVGMNDRVASASEEARTTDKVGGHSTEGEHDPDRAGDTPADVLGRALGDIDGYGSRDTADDRETETR